MSAPIDPVETFRQEAQDLLVQLEEALLDLEDAPDDREIIDCAFRALHTLKGSGAMFGYDDVAAFTHHVENAFDRVRKGTLRAGTELIRIGLAAKDHIRSLIGQPDAANPAIGESILAELRKLIGDDGKTDVATTAHATESGLRSPSGYRIVFRLPAGALATGNNPILLLDELRGLGECQVRALVDAVPPLDDIDPERLYAGWEVVLKTDRPASAIEEVFLFVLDDMELSVVPLDEDCPPEHEDGSDASRPGPAEVSQARKEKPSTTSDNIRIPAERMDCLMDQVGELVIAQSRLKQLAERSADLNLRSIAEEIERLTSELRDTTMGIRMVPIGQLFGRFRRVVHDLSRDLGKQVRLVTSGEETELDKTVIESLNDPLVHLIRNAMDHGIEDAEARAAGGKPKEGLVELSAAHSGAQVLISIRDDGRGIDRDRLRAKGAQMGLIAADAELSDADLYQIILQPGFSTASHVTSVSGRGVGMDVVKRTIDSLRGSIDITSRAGHGSEITLKLPLTLAIIDGLLVRVGQGRYVLPLSAVEECVELSEAEDARSSGRSFLNIRGELVPFLRLRELFNITDGRPPYPKVVIVSVGERRIGLVVDAVLGDHQTVIKSLSKLHADVETFSGATILGDGTVALILDIQHLVDFGQAHEERLKAS